MRRALGVIAVAAVLAGCGGGGGGSGPVEITWGTTPAGVPAATTEPPATQPPATRQAQTTEPNPTSEVTVQSGETFTMPKVTGMVLQDAQDELQRRGSYLMDQEDASGAHRIQVLDRDWRVCTQIPKAGVKVPLSTIVRLAAVKLDERCP